MLGEISLPQWRCAAELVDNSIDGFLRAAREGSPIDVPEIHLNLPTADHVGSKLSVRDNGPGMDPGTLENAVKAGWTSNNPIDNLGLFGMGFNIATAKLGRRTTVWTTRRQDMEWCGLRIDFDELTRQGHFLTAALSRPKADPEEHGTEVVVEALKTDQRQWFAKTQNRTQVVRSLEEAYGTMLRPGGQPLEFSLYLNGSKLRGWQHCVWGSEGSPHREVILPAPTGTVVALQTIDRTLPARPFCQECWQWLVAGGAECPTCGSAGNVVQRPRRIYGWLGIQRYLHDSEYGIDFIRNGRKIELKSKELFDWFNPDGSVEKEYPIDDHRRLGRIVGEIHLDHCRVSYMKDRFDRTDPAWEEMVAAVRGEGPLRPDVARERGFGSNASSLYKLYQAFRRSSPHKKVAGCYSKLLLVPPEHNAKATNMAGRFRSGESQYFTDAEWWALVEEADRALLTEDSGPKPPTPGNAPGPGAGGTATAGDGAPLPGFGAGPAAGAPGAAPTQPAQPPPPPPRTQIKALSREYREPATGQVFNISAFEATPLDPGLGDPKQPWSLKGSPSGQFTFLVNSLHTVFESSTLTPLDALLADVAAKIMDQQRSVRGDTPFATVMANLRELYATPSKLDPDELSVRAGRLLGDIANAVSRRIDEQEGAALFQELSPSEQEDILRSMVTRNVGGAKDLLATGRFLGFAPWQTLTKIFGRHPELFFDGRCWEAEYSSLDLPTVAATEQARAERVRYYSGLLMDLVWLAECDAATLREASRARLLRSALALDLLTPEE